MPAFSARNAQKSAIPTERQPQPLIDPVQFHHQAPRAKAAKTSRDWGIGSGLALVRGENLMCAAVLEWLANGAAVVLHPHVSGGKRRVQCQ